MRKTTLQELVELATAHGFFSSAFGDHLLGLLLDIWLTLCQTYIFYKGLCWLVEVNFSLLELSFVYLWVNLSEQ